MVIAQASMGERLEKGCVFGVMDKVKHWRMSYLKAETVAPSLV
jgi:hypothetical protein